MLVSLYIFFEIIVIVLFFMAFFTKQEILWALTLVISGTMMFTSFNIEFYTYIWNGTLGAYYPVVTSHSYPYLMGLNLLFLALTLLLGLFDLFDKYGSKFTNTKEKINNRNI